jgi:hypothetical protein
MLAAVIVGVSITIGTADEAEITVGRMVGRLVAEVAVVGEAMSEGWTDEDTADAPYGGQFHAFRNTSYRRVVSRIIGRNVVGIVVHCQRKDATGELIK